MHTADPAWGTDIRYEGSDLRQNLTDEFDNVLDLFDNHFDIRSHFVTPNNVPGQWQNTQPDTGANPINQSLEAGARNDLIWIPSSYELGTGGNLWNLTPAERGFVQNGFGNQAWHRSSQGGNLANARSSTMAGASESIAVQSAWLSVVPALHLSLTQLLTYANINTSFTDTSSRAATASDTRLIIERDTGTETIIFNAGQHNTVQTLTIGTGVNQFTLTPTATPTVTTNATGRFEIWYTNDGQIVHLEISEVPQGFNIVANTTNNLAVTRAYNWPTGFGLDPSPNDSIVIAENSFAAVVGEPTAPGGHRFNGWWTTPSGTGVEVTSATAVANRGNTETVDVIGQVYARWRSYVPMPILNDLNLVDGTIAWENIAGVEFLISVNGVERDVTQTENLFDFSDFLPGIYIISIRTVASNGAQSDAIEITVEISEPIHIPVFTQIWTGYEGVRPNIGDTRVVNGITQTLVRWDTVTNIASNSDVTVTHTTVWANVTQNNNFATVVLPWILISGAGLLVAASAAFFAIAAIKWRKRADKLGD